MVLFNELDWLFPPVVVQDNGPIGAAFDERSAGGGGKQNPDGSVKNAAQFTPEELEGILQVIAVFACPS